LFEELEEKVKIVSKEYPDFEIVKIFITHFATPGIIKKAEEKNIIVVQSFEWYSIYSNQNQERR
jgi:hypothetical protein